MQLTIYSWALSTLIVAPTTHHETKKFGDMDTDSSIDFDALTDRLFIRLQLLRYRTQCLRSWRALHRQSWKSRHLPVRRQLKREAVHRAATIVATENHNLMPIWLN